MEPKYNNGKEGTSFEFPPKAEVERRFWIGSDLKKLGRKSRKSETSEGKNNKPKLC